MDLASCFGSAQEAQPCPGGHGPGLFPGSAQGDAKSPARGGTCPGSCFGSAGDAALPGRTCASHPVSPLCSLQCSLESA